MYFKEYLNSISDILDSKRNAYILQTNPSDIGELCEIFIKEFLGEVFSGIFKIYRGGHIIDSKGLTSEQIDIIICSQASMKLFSDKGLFPIESVFGIINVKKTLTHTNLFSNKPKDCGIIKNISSIPIEKYALNIPGFFNQDYVMSAFMKYWPYKVSFAYEGKLNKEWENKLNASVSNENDLLSLPDLIIINKVGYIIKSKEKKIVFPDGSEICKYFHMVEYNKDEQKFAGLSMIVQEIYKSVQWQYLVLPAYHEYFNNEIE